MTVITENPVLTTLRKAHNTRFKWIKEYYNIKTDMLPFNRRDRFVSLDENIKLYTVDFSVEKSRTVAKEWPISR